MRQLNAQWKIFAGLLTGALLGTIANYFGTRAAAGHDKDANGIHDNLDWLALNIAGPIGNAFLRLIIMVVVPLVFSALVLGVVGFGDMRRLGRVGLRTLIYALVLSALAVIIGLVLVDSIKPGAGLDPARAEALRAQYAKRTAETEEKAKQVKHLRDALLDIIPENPLQEAAGAMDGSSKGNGMLAVMFFALIFGVALTRVADDGRRLMTDWLQAVFDACLAIIGFAMKLAPLAVGCLLFATTARIGPHILRSLAWFVVTVLLGLGLHLFVVIPLTLRFFSNIRPVDFFRRIGEVIVTALGTSSSNATLPTSLRVARDRLHLPPQIANFVLTVGATGNQNGTALYEGVVVLFLAQVFGIHLSIEKQVFVMGMAVLAGVGTAGVPSGSLPMIVILCNAVGVPGAGIGIIIGVDRILDMARTVLNVTGDLAIATCVASNESPPHTSRARQQAGSP